MVTPSEQWGAKEAMAVPWAAEATEVATGAATVSLAEVVAAR